jgi:2-methylisocitrate lyase-like PEP mutase family enzyme
MVENENLFARGTFARAARYVAAGADGVYVPGLTVPHEIRTVAASIAAPLNILALLGSTTRSFPCGCRAALHSSSMRRTFFGRADHYVPNQAGRDADNNRVLLYRRIFTVHVDE